MKTILNTIIHVIIYKFIDHVYGDYGIADIKEMKQIKEIKRTVNREILNEIKFISQKNRYIKILKNIEENENENIRQSFLILSLISSIFFKKTFREFSQFLCRYVGFFCTIYQIYFMLEFKANINFLFREYLNRIRFFWFWHSTNQKVNILQMNNLINMKMIFEYANVYNEISYIVKYNDLNLVFLFQTRYLFNPSFLIYYLN